MSWCRRENAGPDKHKVLTLRIVPLWRYFSPVVQQSRALLLWRGGTARPTAFYWMSWLPSLLLRLDWKTKTHTVTHNSETIFSYKRYMSNLKSRLDKDARELVLLSLRQEVSRLSESYRIHLLLTWAFSTQAHTGSELSIRQGWSQRYVTHLTALYHCTMH